MNYILTEHAPENKNRKADVYGLDVFGVDLNIALKLAGHKAHNLTKGKDLTFSCEA